MFPLRKALNWASSDPLALRLVPPRTVLHHFSLMDQFVEVIQQHPGQKQVDRVVAGPSGA